MRLFQTAERPSPPMANGKASRARSRRVAAIPNLTFSPAKTRGVMRGAGPEVPRHPLKDVPREVTRDLRARLRTNVEAKIRIVGSASRRVDTSRRSG